ncbi:DsbA family protein [Streptomyces pristinaespiralis]|uniref:DsbA family protein n=1 Tax=Streptomyces pristinaespiralis TaxID=38300 RepID=UPI00340BC52F
MQVKNARRLTAAVAAGVVGLVLAGCGEAASASAPRAETAPPYASVEQLPEALGMDGTTITVGDPAAQTTVRVYEDPRCPVVEEFELTGGASVLRERTIGRQVKTEYTFASFRDERLGGDGSKRAVNALRAALDVGKFAEYHAVLFRHQAEAEASGGYTTDDLLKLAGEVKGLRGKQFDHAVTTMKYRSFVTASQAAYDAANGDEPLGPGTPTVVINGKQVPEESYGIIFDKPSFEELLTKVQEQSVQWELTT